ncbi:MAG: hypothetical protein M1821_005909 [Bathelium mastoideum]|nr:MAG: hypothetical protein M1821_005909 [Bathelium mastoideum]
MAPQYLITGVTGGLGRALCNTLLELVKPSDIAVSSSSEYRAAEFLAKGVEFRRADYKDPASLEKAFTGIQKLFFVSVNEYVTETRMVMHSNVIDAAKRVAVGHVYYSSLAFGGVEDKSTIDLQQAHLETERLLKSSGLTYTSVREGIYAEAFPCFLSWYPTDPNQELYLCADGSIAYAGREELGEATAKLMIKGGHENEIVLLTGPSTYTLTDVVGIVNEVTGRKATIKFVDRDEYVSKATELDKAQGRKPQAFYQAWVSLLEGLKEGEAATVSPLMGEVLGRTPKDGKELITEFLKADPNYTWHQNYAGA